MAELDQENNVETESDQSEVSIDNLKVLENIEVKLTVEVGSSQLKMLAEKLILNLQPWLSLQIL